MDVYEDVILLFFIKSYKQEKVTMAYHKFPLFTQKQKCFENNIKLG